jgi:hypothetical protein
MVARVLADCKAMAGHGCRGFIETSPRGMRFASEPGSRTMAWSRAAGRLGQRGALSSCCAARIAPGLP